MRFNRLRLNGFKSFVDPTDLAIVDGLTGIVGPNGCGKSNLLEALRWVMGENRPSAMRGAGMEDVIFGGAAGRPARHHAEVTLLIDNSERLAPVAFNGADMIEVVRRITRDGGSSYRIQGREVRARDVQVLFADAASGAHSPALVRQGQIAELIAARPSARRRILEDAAGIAGLYQRRHEAELRLRAAEANLLRIDDQSEALAQQLASLTRQARAAARYREIGAGLREAEGLLLWQHWAEAQGRAAAAAAERDRTATAAAVAGAAAAAAAAARTAAEAALAPLREEEAIAGAVLARLAAAQAALAQEAARAGERIAALTGAIAQVEGDAVREAQLAADAEGTLARLAREGRDLAAAMEGQEARLAAATAAARAAAATLAEVESRHAALTEDAARLSARHQAAVRLAEDMRRARDRATGEARRADEGAAAARAAVAQAESAVAAARAAEASFAATAASAEALLTEAEVARSAVQSREAEARAVRAAAESEAATLRAELAALTRLVERETGKAGRILDAITVAPGFEQALGAALGDDLGAPADPPAGRTGWAALPPLPAATLPAGARPLSDVVTAPPHLARRLGQTGIVPAEAGGALQAALVPGQRLVSAAGDLWRWDGFRLAAADAPSAAAERLRQVNRMVELRRDLEEAAARATGAAQAHAHLAERLRSLGAAEEQARAARREADRRLTEAHRALSQAEAGLSLARGRQEAAAQAQGRHAVAAAEAAEALAAAEAALAGLSDPAALRAAAEAARTEVDAAREAMLAARAAQDEMRRQGEGRARRAEAIAREAAAWTERRATAADRIAALEARRAAAEAELAAAQALPGQVAARQATLAEDIARAETRRGKAATALTEGEATLRAAGQAERDAARTEGEARTALARAEALAETAAAAVAEAAARILEARDCAPADLAPPDGKAPPVAEVEARVAALRRQREALGAVNLRAEEDARALAAEQEALLREKADLEAAIRTLRGGIGSLNREGRERLLAAFEQVNANFAALFTHLFGGGEARLALVESDDPLEAGLEIMCQPPGKRLSVLSLLSGGEQTLTALALIFAVFLANPAPVCVLDEVDAPLDDANVARFCDLMDEMRRRTATRFLVITHHAVTMARMDRLYGVTMVEQGVSQLVSVDLRRAAEMVA